MTLAPQIEVAEHVLSVLGSAIDGYTNPDPEGHCARVVVVGGSVLQGYFQVEVIRPDRLLGTSRERFRVGVSVCPDPHEVGLATIEVSDRGERG